VVATLGLPDLRTERADDRSSVVPSVTVILCTYNRAERLAVTLESLAASDMPPLVAWEVLIVDNNSTDQTGEVAKDFERRYPGRFRYLFEPNPGKSYALNSGIVNARGDVLAFVDDDVTVEPTWLQNLTAELHGGGWAGAAGRTLPEQAFTPPPWLPWKELGCILCAYFDLGDQPSELGQGTPPYGANMAFRRLMFEKYGGFRTDLGPSPNGKTPRPNEDTEFGRRLFGAGERLRYEPRAVVYHPVPQGRITKEYFLTWCFDLGRASIVERGDRSHVWGIPRDYLSFLHRVISLLTLTLRRIFAVDQSKRFYWRCLIKVERGMMVELYRRRRGRKGSNAAVLS
jgi:glycosyltransferase involved in cell wall biosynthesis